MSPLLPDLRHSLRVLRRSPGFTLAAVATLALGIGSTTAIFSAVNGVLLKPLPYPDPDRLVVVWGRHVTGGTETASLPDFLDWRRDARAFAGLAALTNTRFGITGTGEPELVRGVFATANLLSTMGVAPSVGRAFTAEEERAAAPRVAMLGHGFWLRRFGASRDVVGRPINLNGVPYTVVGVVPPSFRLQHAVDVWVPLATDTTQPRRADFLTVFGRLRPGMELRQAQEEMTTIMRRLEAQYPASNAGWGAEVVGLREQMVGGARPALLLFMGAVLLVLLIACANVANLMLVRVASRDREITIRAALGASRRRLVQQVLTESVLLSLLGGAIGVWVAVWGTRALASLGSGTIPRAQEIEVDPAALAFALLVSVLSGLLFGLAPVGRILRQNPAAGLQEGSRGVSSGAGVRNTRSLLVLGEVALAFVLLSGAALLLRSFDRLLDVDPGYAGDHVVTSRVTLPPARYQQTQLAPFAERLLERVRALPGVGTAAVTSGAPLEGSANYWSFVVSGVVAPAPGVVQDAAIFMTSPEYFETLGIPLRDGRLYQAADRADAPGVVVISEGLAQRYWPGRSPVGARISFGNPADSTSWVTVIGVVGDVHHETLNAAPYPQAYFPIAQAPIRSLLLTVRVLGGPRGLVPALKGALADLDPELPLAEGATLDDWRAMSLARPRINASVLGGFAIAALLLAAVGIYGVIGYGVVQRTRELGIRAALGARPADLLGLVLRQGLAPVAAGMLVGLGGALAGTRMLRGMLFGVGATDPLTFAAVALFLAGVAVMASYLPARRAARIDPIGALRAE